MSERKGIFGRLFGGSASAADEPWSRFADLFQELQNGDLLGDLADAGNDGRPMDPSVIDRERARYSAILDKFARAVADYNRGLEEDRRNEERSDRRPLDAKAEPIGAHRVYSGR